MVGLRLLLVVDALALAAASPISDPIVGDVVRFPVLLVWVVIAVAVLSAELVRPRRRIGVVCASLSVVAPFPFVALGNPLGSILATVAMVALQAIPVVRGGLRPSGDGPLRRVLAALVLTTTLLLLAVVALVWYGDRYLLRPPKGVFARGPYLTRLTSHAADFSWRLRSGRLRATLSALAPDGSVVEAEHGRLRGLVPGTRYSWTADVGGESEAAGTFRTAPRSTATPITLVSFGDYGSGSSHEYAVARLAAAADPSLFLSAGDNAYLVAAPPLLDRAIFRPLRALLAEAPMVAALGEHDLAWNDGSAVISALRLPGHDYAVQYGPVQIVVLGLEASRSGAAYAARVLGRCRRPCPVRFVLVHRPIAAGNAIMPLLRARRVAAILAAHLHRYERHDHRGVLEFTVGTGGEGPGSATFTRATPDAQVSLLNYGFLRIDIQRGRIEYRFVDERGRILDRTERRIPAG